MATIFYSMCGEGRGHAARVRSMVEHLRHDHRLVLYAPEQAYDFLAPHYSEEADNVVVRRIPGLRFRYTGGRLDLCKSIASGVGYLFRLQSVVATLTADIERERPDLAITDFEPVLPRAAERCGVPYISLDHQHFLVACDLRSLPFCLRQWARAMGFAVRMHHWQQKATIVSSFFQAPLLAGGDDVQQIGPLLRPDIQNAVCTSGSYFLAYLRLNTSPTLLELLHRTGRKVRVYGLGAREDSGQLTFRELNDRTFVEDMAGCAGVIGAAGNQTIGEALYLGKPVFALPEHKHHEQRINAHFVTAMGAGESAIIEHVRSSHFDRFLNRLEEYKENVARRCQGRIDGTPYALSAIKRQLTLPALV